ncbi:MAG TPA: hypothetical protein DEW35_02840 [Ruminococcaceae bacterium]|nr:hypothetical protein [Oscillospiraceae bacterium]
MENKNEKVSENTPNQKDSTDNRLSSLAEKNNLTVEQFLDSLEQKQEVISQNNTAKSRSTGSQSSESRFGFDPAGSEFLKGIWGK